MEQEVLTLHNFDGTNIQIPKRIGKYEIDFLIGRGGYSYVFQGRDIKNTISVALKFVSREYLTDPRFMENIEKEQRIYSRLSHPGIAKYLDTIYLDDYIVIVQELLVGGTLSSMPLSRTSLISDSIILRWGKELLETIAYLHSHGIAHCDIKPENIGFDQYSHVKLIDFGLCTDHLREKTYKCGTPYFSAPEVFLPESHDDFKADIWSYGITMYFLRTGEFPFENHDLNKFMRKITHPGYIKIKCDGPVRKLVEMCLEFDPHQRKSAQEILKTNIFDGAEVLFESISQKRSIRVSLSTKLTPSKRRASIVIPHSVSRALTRTNSSIPVF